MAQLTIAYILNDRWPTIKAYGLQVAKTCEAFVSRGASVALIVPWRRTHQEIRGKSIDEIYALRDPLDVHYVPSLDMTALHIQSKILFALQQVLYAAASLLVVLRKPGVLYTRDLITVRVMRLLKRRLFWEAHRISPKISASEMKMLKNSIAGVIAITQGVADELLRRGYPSEKICIAPDGFDPSEFQSLPSREDARRLLGWRPSERYVVYVGHLFEHKGVDVLIDSAQNLVDIHVVIVGGTQEDQARVKLRDVRHCVEWIPFTQHDKALLYMRAADVVVLPNRKDGGQSERYTSPMKMFEYMASGTPIVASDLPSLREVLHDQSALFVTPDSPESLTKGIMIALRDSEQASQRARIALQDVASYSWSARAKKIMNFIESMSV